MPMLPCSAAAAAAEAAAEAAEISSFTSLLSGREGGSSSAALHIEATAVHKCPLLSALNSEHSPRSGSRRSREGRIVRFSVNFLQCRGRVQSGIRRARCWSTPPVVYHLLSGAGRGAVNRFRICYHGTPEISGCSGGEKFLLDAVVVVNTEIYVVDAWFVSSSHRGHP